MNIWIVQCLLSFVVWGPLQAGEHEVTHGSSHETVHVGESGGEHSILIVHPAVLPHLVEAIQVTRDSSIHAGSDIHKPIITTTVMADQVIDQGHKKGSDTVDEQVAQQAFAGTIVVPIGLEKSPDTVQQSLMNPLNEILITLQKSASILQADPANVAAKTSINNFSKKLEGFKKKVEKLTMDEAQRKILEEGIQKAQEIVDEFGSGAKPKSIDTKPKKIRPVTESTKISLADIPSLPADLKPNTFGMQEQLPHQGEIIKKQVAGLLTAFPYELSPVRGMIDIANGSLDKQWDIVQKNGDKNALITKLFYTLDGHIAQTHQGGNFAMSLSPKIIGQLIRIIATDPSMLLQLDEDFLKNWHVSYLAAPMPEEQRQLKNPKYFKDQAKDFLKSVKNHIKDEASKQEVVDLLLCYMMMDIYDAGVVASDYAKGLGIEFKPVYYTDKDYELVKRSLLESNFTENDIQKMSEQVLLFVAMKEDFSKYIFTSTAFEQYKGNTFASCKETTLRKIINLILYNRELKSLDFEMLPQTIQSTASEQLKKFISKYGKKGLDDKDSVRAFLDLVEDKKEYGMRYNYDTYEITGEIGVAVAALKMLFGIENIFNGTPAEQFNEILKLLFNNGEREFSLSFSGEGESNWSFDLNQKDYKKVSGTIYWGASHAAMKIEFENQNVTSNLVKNLYLAGKALDLYILGAYDITLPLSLYHLIHESVLKTKEDFIDLFSQYTSQFDQAIPEVFYGEHWGNLFKNISDDVAFNLLEAAVENGFDKSSSKGILLEAFRAACEKKNFLTVTKLLDFGTKPSALILELIVTSPFSDMKKKTLLKRLRDTGLASDDICSLLMKASSKNILLLVQSGVDINAFNSQGNTPLILAASTYNELAFDALIKAGAKVDMPNTAGKTISDVLVDAVQESLVFFKTLTTIDSWKEQSDQFFKMGELENMMEKLIALPDARINAADKKRLERALKDFSEGRAQAGMNYEELYS